MTCSVLAGRSAATCSFVRRSMKGRMRARRLASLGAEPRSMKRRNSAVKRSGEGSRPGALIDSSDHRSAREFSMGVPVIATVEGARRRRTAL